MNPLVRGRCLLCLVWNRGLRKGNMQPNCECKGEIYQNKNMLWNWPKCTRFFSISKCVSSMKVCFLQGLDLGEKIGPLWREKSLSQWPHSFCHCAFPLLWPFEGHLWLFSGAFVTRFLVNTVLWSLTLETLIFFKNTLLLCLLFVWCLIGVARGAVVAICGLNGFQLSDIYQKSFLWFCTTSILF